MLFVTALLGPSTWKSFLCKRTCFASFGRNFENAALLNWTANPHTLRIDDAIAPPVDLQPLTS